MPFTVTMPKLSPTMEEGVIAKWHKREGEFVEAGALLLEITTDKATLEHYALDEGWLRKIMVQEGDAAIVNQPIAIFTVKKEESMQESSEKNKPEEKEPSKTINEPEKTPVSFSTGSGLLQPAFIPEPALKQKFTPPSLSTTRIVASPLAKKLAQEQGRDLTAIKGSGPGGRIVAKDVERAPLEGFLTSQRGSKETPGSYEEIAMSPMRKAIAKRLQESKTFIPHFYVKKSIDAEPLMAIRAQLQEMGVKVTVNDLMLRASALALRKHPEINRGFNSVSQKIIQFKTIDISVAVTLEEGLITPIIRECDHKNLQHIASEIRELAARAREGKLEEHEYKGGSFCLSNLGMYGIDEFSAVINPPQAAILAVGGVKEEAVIKEGQLAIGKRLHVVLSADHRVIDGSQAAQFLTTLAKLIENPVALTL